MPELTQKILKTSSKVNKGSKNSIKVDPKAIRKRLRNKTMLNRRKEETSLQMVKIQPCRKIMSWRSVWRFRLLRLMIKKTSTLILVFGHLMMSKLHLLANSFIIIKCGWCSTASIFYSFVLLEWHLKENQDISSSNSNSTLMSFILLIWWEFSIHQFSTNKINPYTADFKL